MKDVTIFTDGSSIGNPGPGGWGAVIFYPEGLVHELGDVEAQTTNNKMELTAILCALEEVGDTSKDIELFSDSRYCINGITKWSLAWQKNNWQTKAKEPVTNQETWKALVNVKERLEKNGSTIRFTYVPGHADHPGNERADAIARNLAEGKNVELYSGARAGSSFRDLSDQDLVVDEAKLKEQKKTKSKNSGKAFSYVSLVGGKIMTHQTWEQCKARVHGASGAKFKKATSQENEDEIIKSFQS